MIDLASIALGYRLLIAVGVMIGPTLLFLGLCRFLEWLRDDRMIQQLARREDYADAKAMEPTLGDVVAGLTGSPSRANLVRCGHCGAPNLPDASACLECGQSP